MEHYLGFILGNLFSCFITSFIVFQYMREAFQKKYHNKSIYILLQAGVSISMLIINLFRNPVLNLVSWIMVFGVIAAVFYNDCEKNMVRRVFKVMVLLLILVVCETVGYIILEFIIKLFQITYIHPLILQCLRVTFSKLSLLVLYYFIVIRIWKSGRESRLSWRECIVYGLIIFYSILNLSLILISVSNINHIDSGKMMLLLNNMFGIVFIDLLFLNFTEFSKENRLLKLRLLLLEQQASIQYEYYIAQEEKYNESVKILHDVNRHLNMVEEIYQVEKANKAKEYTKEIQKILQPLIPQQYTNNPILNILLSNKKRSAAVYDINFALEIGKADLGFMESIEVTTVFGNLLDNAIEACQQVGKDRYIKMRLDTYHDFVAVHIENSTNGNRKWSNGKPISRKGKDHGIGLINVENIVKKYNGSIILEENNKVFSCSIIFNG